MVLVSGAMSTPFRVDLDDLRFVLFEQLRIDETLKRVDRFAELDRDLYDATLAEGAKIAKEVLHPINRPGDLEGCKLDADGNVTTPKGYKDAWRQMAEGGWIAPTAPPELGGAGLPAVMAMALNDMFIGAATAFMMYPGLTAAAGRMAWAHAPAELRELVAGKLFRGEWAGTMCLTEAGAGSSVGDNRAKAVPTDEPGIYELEGEKIFISGGDHDLAENIIHFVLARTPGAPAGTKGLSLFMVPKFMFGPDGKLGERNGAKVVGIEHKMGIHGSSTCVLALGSDRPCRGWIVGEELQGIRLMFQMMNEARIGVAAQGESMAAAAYGYAVQYAAERVQGTDIREYKNPNAPRVTINRHPDVRRMLMTLKVHAETMRAAMLRLAMNFDMSEQLDDEAERKKIYGRVDLLTPVLKSHCTDTGFEMTTTAVQVYGGYGYIAEFPVEQLVRDAKIQSIYEGTNGIQAMDLLGRKMRMEGGALFMSWLQDGQKLVAQAKEAGLSAQAEAVGKAIGQLGAAAMHLSKLAGGGKIAEAFYMAVPFQSAFGIVVCALEALDQARIAREKIGAGDDRPLLRGKLLNLDFYVAHVLPKAIAYAKTVQSSDASALDEVLFA